MKVNPLYETVSEKIDRAVEVNAARIRLLEEMGPLLENAYDPWVMDNLMALQVSLGLLLDGAKTAEELYKNHPYGKEVAVTLGKFVFVAMSVLGEDPSLPYVDKNGNKI